MEHDIRLDDTGWKALRERQVSVEKMTLRAIRTAHDCDGKVHLLDLALGSGRHVMDVLRSLPDLEITATFQDTDRANLDRGRQLANQLGLTRVSFQLGDSFDPRELANLDPSPNVVLAAGLYELTSDNKKVLDSLRGLAGAMLPAGQLIYTDQPKHPHLEMIGRVAVQREESPWAMRRRTLEEMDGLLTEAGFELVERSTDPSGLFCVGLARVRSD